ncbi:MAG: GGDEF domain-containing response regulator [Deltaproteobacteria bacterium]|nr:MAG: GGDEF domain-containing response regulator [Deltaproteobacteria bacterium]
MAKENINVLLIEDNPDDKRFIRETLSKVRGVNFNLKCAGRLSAGLKRLGKEGIDVVLLDLDLPDSKGPDTISGVLAQAPNVPIIVMTYLDDEAVAVKTVHEGAQDYLVKGQIDGHILPRVIRYAIERQKMMAELRNLSLVDELTGLYNRRGFFTLVQQQLKIADRTRRGMLLLFCDIDNMKWINDTLGHQKGDQALLETAEVLEKTFRDSDITARIGGDEFVVLMIEVGKSSAKNFINRLQNKLKVYNNKGDHRYKLSLSIGIAQYDPKNPCSIEDLLARADRLMYEQKRSKQKD